MKNYKRFYEIYLNGMQGNFTASDSADLETLANACPRLHGAVVYQARGFHNSYYNAFKHYEDHCPTITPEERSLNGTKIDFASSSLFVYPNPTTGKIYISGFNLLYKSTSVMVTDLAGKIIVNRNSTVENGIVELSLDLADGVYFVHLTDGKGIKKAQKIIIQR